MRILSLGATGMFGPKLMQVFSKKFTVTGSVRNNASDLANNPFFSGLTILGDIRADNLAGVQKVIKQTKPDTLINCIGIVKQLPAAQDPLQSIAINALFPHQLAKICRQENILLIHISSDCVFSGYKGHYTENDLSDADDLYGKTKFFWESELFRLPDNPHINYRAGTQHHQWPF